MTGIYRKFCVKIKKYINVKNEFEQRLSIKI